MNIKISVLNTIENFLDDLSYEFGDDDSREQVYQSLQNLGYSDLADAWYDWCSSDEEGWPNK